CPRKTCPTHRSLQNLNGSLGPCTARFRDNAGEAAASARTSATAKAIPPLNFLTLLKIPYLASEILAKFNTEFSGLRALKRAAIYGRVSTDKQSHIDDRRPR